MIRQNRVEICTLDKCAVAKLGDKVDLDNENIKVDGKIVNFINDFIYYAINKPEGYTSSVSDVNAKKLVISLVPRETKVWPVGRLDKDSCGLMILTNDGELTNQLTHPRYKHEKEYLVTVSNARGPITSQILYDKNIRLRKGLRLSEGSAKFDKLEVVEIDEKQNIAKLKVVLHQGWKRQIRRMCEKVGLNVIELKRIRINKLLIGDLALGKYKVVQKSDIL